MINNIEDLKEYLGEFPVLTMNTTLEELLEANRKYDKLWEYTQNHGTNLELTRLVKDSLQINTHAIKSLGQLSEYFHKHDFSVAAKSDDWSLGNRARTTPQILPSSTK